MKRKPIQQKGEWIPPAEREKYLLSGQRDFEILAKCKQLEKLKLKKEDRVLVRLF